MVVTTLSGYSSRAGQMYRGLPCAPAPSSWLAPLLQQEVRLVQGWSLTKTRGSPLPSIWWSESVTVGVDPEADLGCGYGTRPSCSPPGQNP